MKLTPKNKTQVIRETDYGCYVWQLPDGNILNRAGQYMLVFGTYGDRASIKAITDAARGYGFPDGKPMFWPDVRPVSDEEFESQQARAEAGLIPDPFDLGAIKEEMEAIQRGD